VGSAGRGWQADRDLAAVHQPDGMGDGRGSGGRQDSRDPVRVALAPTEDAEWRNGDGFLRGWEAIHSALWREWVKELDDRLSKDLWCLTGDRISLRFEDEWHDARGRWRRNQGNGYRQVDADGPMRRRDASFDDVRIVEAEHGYR
jgi:nuclear transport factor 2 (NTF2) superfamily protein